MPTKSAAQERLMQGVAHNPAFAKKVGIPQSVGKEFVSDNILLTPRVGKEEIDEIKGDDEDPCWSGYEQLGMKTKGGKEVPNCVPTADAATHRVNVVVSDPKHTMVSKRNEKTSKTIRVGGSNREEAIARAVDFYKKRGFKVHDWNYIAADNAFSRIKSDLDPNKSPSGGLSEKGRKAYNREHGAHLKRPQPEGGARKESFCARMKGLKKNMASEETKRDPESRVNLALKKWKCDALARVDFDKHAYIKYKLAKHAADADNSIGSQQKEWMQIQQMDKGSALGDKNALRKRLLYLYAMHNYYKKHNQDTAKVRKKIEEINRLMAQR
jgi:hypothetical protein